MNRSARRPRGPIPQRAKSAAPTGGFPGDAWLLGGATMLLVARPLLAIDSHEPRGYGMPFVWLWLLLAAAAFLQRWRSRADSFVWCWPDAGLLAFLGCVGLSTWNAYRHGQPEPALNAAWEWVGLLVAYFVLRLQLRQPAQSRALVAVCLALVVGLSLAGLRQYFITFPQMRAAYDADPDESLRQAGQWAEPGSAERWRYEQRIHSTEPTATLVLANSLAGVLAGSLVLGWSVAVALYREPAWRRRFWLLSGALFLVVVCLMLTKSRSAYGALGAGLLLAMLATEPALRRSAVRLLPYAAALVGVVVGIGVAVGGLDLLVLTESLKSLAFRWQYWQATLGIVRDYPLWGCGGGNFQSVYAQYKLPLASELIADPHNWLLEIAATLGLPALAAFLLGLGGALWLSRPRRAAAHLLVDSVRDAAQPLAAPRPAAQLPTLDERRAAALPVFFGALAGFVLAAFLGMHAPAPPDGFVLLLGAGAAALVLVLVWPWVESGELPRGAAWAAALCLLVNLLAAGGIAYPAVANLLWTCLALAQAERGAGLTRWPRAVVGGAALLCLAASVTCYATVYAPQRAAAERLADAEAAMAGRDGSAARAALLAATAADPLHSEAWQFLAQTELDRWAAGVQVDPASHATLWPNFERAAAAYIALLPRSSSAAGIVSDWYLQAYELHHDSAELAAAVQWIDRAAELYPSSPAVLAKTAQLRSQAGQTAAAADAARQALALHAQTPHADQKLPPEVVAELERLSAN